jgi:adenylate cyclase
MSDDDAVRCVRCAIEMRRSFRRMMDRGDAGDEGKGLEIHIGINTGQVVAGTVGSSLRMEYTALGDTVNVAARLESLADASQVVIGSTTAELVKKTLKLIPLGPRMLKGRDEPVEIFEVPDDADAGDDTVRTEAVQSRASDEGPAETEPRASGESPLPVPEAISSE